MISVSDGFKGAMKAPVKVLRASISLDEGETYSSENNLVSLSIEQSGYYFGSTTKILNFKLLGVDYELVDKVISVLLEVQNDQIWESCSLGKFTIVEQTTDLEAETTSFKAYDPVGMMGITDYDNSLTFPCTVSKLAEQMANRFSLAYEPSELVNGDYVISEDLYSTISDLTYRDILSEIAGATTTIASVDGEFNTLNFSPLQFETDEIWTYENLKRFSHEPIYGPLNSVVLARTPAEDNIVLKDDESIAENGLTELKLANNEILDDNREELISPILDSVDGFSFYPFEATTEGHGWYQCGDRIRVEAKSGGFEVIITYIKLSLDGGIRETIKGVRPEETDTDYSLAGGITKTIYNTQIKVDKQNQKIESVVEEQSVLEGKMNDNFTQISQNITNVITSVQNSGGNNLLKNSAMYALDENNLPTSWTLVGDGTISISPSAEAAVNGSLSRQNISLKDKTISQTVEVKADSSAVTDKTYYSFSCKIKKSAAGFSFIQITDGTESGVWAVRLENGEETFYGDFGIEKILPNSSNLTVSVYSSADSEFSITDMMLSVGDYKTQWTQANGEFANTQVSIDTGGITVRSSSLDGTYTKQTPQEISTYYNNQLAATLNNDGLKAPKATFGTEINMPPIKIVPQSDGWAFVKGE